MTRAAEIVGFIGRKSSGKSFEGLQEVAKHKHAIRVDLNNQPDMEKGAFLVPTVAALAHLARNFDRRKKQQILWRGEGAMSHEEKLVWAGKFATAVGGVALFADEAQLQLPKTAKPHPILADIIQKGRHIGGPDPKKPLGVPFIWTAVVDTNVTPELRNQSDRLTYFRGFDSVYKKRLYDIFDRELVDQLMSAPQYSKLVMDNQKGPSFIPYEK